MRSMYIDIIELCFVAFSFKSKAALVIDECEGILYTQGW